MIGKTLVLLCRQAAGALLRFDDPHETQQAFLGKVFVRLGEWALSRGSLAMPYSRIWR